MANKIMHEPGIYFDCTPMHGKWCTITMTGQDVGYAQVGILSSGRNHILFQYRGKRGIAVKAYVKHIVEVRMSERQLRKQQELVVEEWDEDVNPFSRFVGTRCDIHVHQTRMFEASPGFFRAKILYVTENAIRIRENGSEYDVNPYMICGMMES